MRTLRILSLLLLPSVAAAETREYAVLVNGKEAGQSTVTTVESPDGKVYMKAKVSVKVPGILFPYALEMDVQEWWLKDRLTNMTAVTTENSKKTEVAVKAEADRLLVSVNGKIRAISWEAWTSGFWKLADKRFHNKDVPVFEPDSGKDVVCKLEYVGTEKMKVGGDIEDCFRFRVTGLSSPTELWFDRFHRLVRQEFTESGQKTIVQLMSRKN